MATAWLAMGRMAMTWTLGCMLGAGSVKVPSVEGLRDTARPLLVFTPSVTDPRFVAQVRALKSDEAGLRERQLVLLVFAKSAGDQSWRKQLDPALWRQPADGEAARHQYSIQPNDFTVVLVGKDGGEKLRTQGVVPFETLRSTVDAMPMRRAESKRQ